MATLIKNSQEHLSRMTEIQWYDVEPQIAVGAESDVGGLFYVWQKDMGTKNMERKADELGFRPTGNIYADRFQHRFFEYRYKGDLEFTEDMPGEMLLLMLFEGAEHRDEYDMTEWNRLRAEESRYTEETVRSMKSVGHSPETKYEEKSFGEKSLWAILKEILNPIKEKGNE